MLDLQSSSLFPMAPEDLADLIDIPLSQWPGNCHAIACAIRDLAPVKGMRVARGHYHGSISRESVYSGGPLQQHSWLVAPDGRILDPTRWAMECPEHPEIYLGPCDHYDEGGRALAACMPPPFPGRGPDFSANVAKLGQEDRAHLARLVGLQDPHSPILSDQIRRAAQLDPDDDKDLASLYQLLEKAGLKGIVPIDSWVRVMQPETIYCRPDANRYFTLPEAEGISPQILVARLLVAFCLVEHRDNLSEELEEHDISLEGYYESLDRFEKWDMPLEYLPNEDQFTLGVVISDLLGNGFGQSLRVERYAASLGYQGARCAKAINEVAAAFGLCEVW